MNNTIKDLRNGLGYIYVVEADGATFVNVLPNTAEGVLAAQKKVYFSAPLAGNIASVGRFSLTGGAGTITSITVNGVNILGSTATGASLALLAADAVSKINTYISAPDYTAVVSGDEIVIQADPAAGSGPNSYVVAGAITGTVTYTVENMSGGCDTQGLYDPTYGLRAFLNADYDADGCSGQGTASAVALTNAIEVTKYLVNRGFQTSFITDTQVISNGSIVVDRESSITILYVDTEAAAASDNLDSISTDSFNENDLLIIRGVAAGRVVTATGSGNINLANSENFLSGDETKVLMLRLISGAWYEECRAPFNAISVAYLRSLNIATPVQGVDTQVLPTNGTISFTPGTDKGYQEFTGSPVLVGSVVIDHAGTPLDGDSFTVKYVATPTTGVNTVTIFGITLTDTQAQGGNVTVYAVYDLANTQWDSTLVVSPVGFDWLTTSSTGGVLYSDCTNTGTAANLTNTLLKSFTMGADQLGVNGSVAKVKAYFTFAANANLKTWSILLGASTLTGDSDNYNGEELSVEVEINRVSSTSQFLVQTILSSDTTFNLSRTTTAAENLTNALTIGVYAQNGTATANDTICERLTIEYLPKI